VASGVGVPSGIGCSDDVGLSFGDRVPDGAGVSFGDGTTGVVGSLGSLGNVTPTIPTKEVTACAGSIIAVTTGVDHFKISRRFIIGVSN